MLHYIFITFHTGFEPPYSHGNPTKSLHIEKNNLFLTKKLRAVAITRNSRKSFSGEFRVPSYRFSPIRKNDNSEIIMTSGLMLGSENSEFQVIVFVPCTQKR